MINGQIGSGWLKLASMRRPGGLSSQPLEAHYYSNKRIDPFIKLPQNLTIHPRAITYWQYKKAADKSHFLFLKARGKRDINTLQHMELI